MKLHGTVPTPKLGGVSGDGAITPLWVLSKTATMLQGRDVFQYIDQRDVATPSAGDRSAMLRPFPRQRGSCIRTFQRGDKILHETNAWQKATTKTRGSDSKWELWVASSPSHQEITDLQLTTSGVWIDMPMTEEDKLYGPAAPKNSSTSSIIASDGSVKSDGSMGAAAVRLPSNAENKYEVQSSSFTGPISSTSAELRGLTLAQSLIRPVDEKKLGDRSASPPDSSLIWGSSGHSGWIKARPQGAAVVTPHRAWDLWESNPRGPGASQAA